MRPTRSLGVRGEPLRQIAHAAAHSMRASQPRRTAQCLQNAVGPVSSSPAATVHSCALPQSRQRQRRIALVDVEETPLSSHPHLPLARRSANQPGPDNDRCARVADGFPARLHCVPIIGRTATATIVHFLSGLAIGGKEMAALRLARRGMEAGDVHRLLLFANSSFHSADLDLHPGPVPHDFAARRELTLASPGKSRVTSAPIR